MVSAHPEEGLSKRSASKARLEGLSRGLEVDLLDPLRPENRLAARPAGRGRGALADRLEQDAAAIRVKVRKRGGRAEGGRQPRPRCGADQPFVEETISGKVQQPVLAEIEGRKGDQHSDERLDHVEAAVVRHLEAQMKKRPGQSMEFYLESVIRELKRDKR